MIGNLAAILAAILTAIWQANRWLFLQLYDREFGSYSRGYMAGKQVAILAAIWQANGWLFSRLYDRQFGSYSRSYSRSYMAGKRVAILAAIWQTIRWLFSQLYDREMSDYSHSYMTSNWMAWKTPCFLYKLNLVSEQLWRLFSETFLRVFRQEVLDWRWNMACQQHLEQTCLSIEIDRRAMWRHEF